MKPIPLLFMAASMVTMPLLANAFTNTKHFGKHLCPQPGFECVKVNKGDTWIGLFPDARQRDLVMRLNRTNVALKHRPWIVVPDNLHYLHIMDISPFPEHIPAPGERVIHVDLSEQAFGAYNKSGYLVAWGPASGGKAFCPSINKPCPTVTGTFRMFRKQGAGCKSSKYPIGKGGAQMPYCMFFYKGYAMHASTLPGHHASHGCLRLFMEDAEWLNKGFIHIGNKGRGTKVVVME